MVAASPSHRYYTLTGVACALLAAVAFSGKAIFVKLAYAYHVDAVSLLTLRMMFSLPLFVVVALWPLRNTTGAARALPLNGRDWTAVILLGLLGYYVGSLLDFYGLLHITASLERLILFLYPTLVLLLSALFLKRRINKTKVAALILSYSGVVLVFVHGISLNQESLLLGAGLVFGCALSYAIYLIGSGEIVARIGVARFTAYSMIAASIAIFIQFALTRPLAVLDLPVAVYGLSFAMAILSTVMPVFLLTEALHRIGASKTAIIGSIGPVSTLAFGVLFLDEVVSALQILGTTLVISGVLWISLTKHQA
jgi:drug/metabolite transporter (DMT)-like permease